MRRIRPRDGSPDDDWAEFKKDAFALKLHVRSFPFHVALLPLVLQTMKHIHRALVPVVPGAWFVLVLHRQDVLEMVSYLEHLR